VSEADQLTGFAVILLSIVLSSFP